jgi:hypothetical protein
MSAAKSPKYIESDIYSINCTCKVSEKYVAAIRLIYYDGLS